MVATWKSCIPVIEQRGCQHVCGNSLRRDREDSRPTREASHTETETKLLAVVPEDMRAALARAHNILPAVAIEVDNPDLETDTRAIFRHGELLELKRVFVPLEVVDDAGIA